MMKRWIAGSFTGLVLSSSLAFASPPPAPLLSIGLIADIQYCDVDPEVNLFVKRYFRKSLEKLERAVSSLNAQSVDFNVSLGDYVDRGAESYEAVDAIFKRLSKPAYRVLGNHDFYIEVDSAFNPVRTIERARVLQLQGFAAGAKPYYEFGAKGWRFVFPGRLGRQHLWKRQRKSSVRRSLANPRAPDRFRESLVRRMDESPGRAQPESLNAVQRRDGRKSDGLAQGRARSREGGS
jgi:3',5'-cyclic AMP phosphodiesterase CpdA